VARQDKSLAILHVEDDDNDAVLLVKACEKADFPATVCRVCDAQQAEAFLLGSGSYADRFLYPLPQIIVLDLKLPGRDGFEFLKWLRAQEQFSDLPVLVFTSSLSAQDKVRAEAEGADSFFVKPISFDAWVNMVRTLKAPEENN
jgi:DNA-binding response OmpR family regulator